LRYLLAPFLILVFLSACRADDASVLSLTEVEVQQAQATRLQAMLDVNVDALDGLLADDLTYTHSTGLLETKREFLEALQAQTIRYLSISPHDIRVRVYDDSAVVTGITAVRVHVGGQDRAASLRITEVHRRNKDGWQLVAYQSTRVPEQE